MGFELGQLQSLGVWSSPNHCQRTDEEVGEELWPALNSPPVLGRPVRYAVLGPGHLCISARLGDRASPVRTPPRILLPPQETWACHAKALPHRLLLQVRGETQKEAEELKKANTLSLQKPF